MFMSCKLWSKKHVIPTDFENIELAYLVHNVSWKKIMETL